MGNRASASPGPAAFADGHPFPLPVPMAEGVRLSLWDKGMMTLILQYPDLAARELKAFKEGFRRYGILRAPTPFPVAMLSFEFTQPLGMVSCPFNAAVEPRQRIEDYLDQSQGLRNGLHVFLLNGPILVAQKLIGLDTEAILYFHSIIKEQISGDFCASKMKTSTDFILNAPAHFLMSASRTFEHNPIR